LGPRPEPTDASFVRQRVFARLFAEEASVAEPEQASGRFALLEPIGRGGMGTVFRAYDPKLDRVVAVKVLHEGHREPSSAGSRLLREAQAMARLNHPNVAVVHEVSTIGDQVFIVMEFVEGQTLTAWMRASRTRDEILACFRQAASGLCAAHRAGIVHRDFKPDNVMVGRDGRVRVMDFGLARAVEQAEDVAVSRSTTPASDPLRTPLTQTGALIGTPAYMAPEQHLGAPADALSDQFSFCVALYEAIHGTRPFTGRTYHELAARVIRGQREPLSVAPRWLGAVLERGLSVDPKQRFPAMDALLLALEGPPRRARLFLLGGAALLPVAVFSAWSAAVRPSCEDTATALQEVWGPERKRQVESRMLASDRPFAATVWRSTETLLDRYAERWGEASGELCAARHVGAERGVLLDRRAGCLAARKEELDAFVTVLLKGGEDVLLEAVQAAATLSELRVCEHPTGADATATSGELRRHLVHAKVDAALGRYAQAIASAHRVRDLAQADHEPIALAEALILEGQSMERLGRAREAEDTLREAVRIAAEAEAYELRAIALTHLVYLVGVRGEFHEARALAADARAVLDVLGAAPLLRAQVQANLGVAARRAERLDEALTHYRDALEVFEANYGSEHPSTARTQTNMGTVLSQMGRYDEANVHLRSALASFEGVLGAKHPLVATALGALANNLARQGDLAGAAKLQDRVLEIRRSESPDGHPATARTLFNIAKIAFSRGLAEDAAQAIAEGRGILASVEPLPDETAAQWDLLEASVELQRGHVASAKGHLGRALAASPQLSREFDVMLLQWTIDAHEDPRGAMERARREVEGRSLSDRERDRFSAWLAVEESLVSLLGATTMANP